MGRMDTMLERALITLGRDVTYTRLAGGSFTLRIMPAQEDDIASLGYSQIKSDATLYECRVAEFSGTAPAAGDTILDSGDTFTVKNFHRPDPERLLYLLECK